MCKHRHVQEARQDGRWCIARLLCLVLIIPLMMQVHLAMATPDMKSQLAVLEQQWAKASYQTPMSGRKAAFKDLLQQAEQISKQYPGQAEPLAWRGMILCSYAEVIGGLSALDDVTAARDLFLQAKGIDAHVMNGTVDGYLGTLYYKVPPWPIGFGDEKKAQSYFQQAVALNPDGIDPNYLYGHYLADKGEKTEARDYLNRGLQAPIRADHADYDAGRRMDIEESLAKVN